MIDNDSYSLLTDVQLTDMINFNWISKHLPSVLKDQ